MYVVKNSQIQELFFHILLQCNFPFTLFNGTRLLQLVLFNGQARTDLQNEISVPSVFEAQPSFHSMDLISRELERIKLNIIRSLVSSTLAGLAVQLVQKSSDSLSKPCSLRPLRVIKKPYLLFSLPKIQFRLLLYFLDSFLSLKEQDVFSEGGRPC